MMKSLLLRPLLPDEEPLVWQFLILAAHEEQLEVVKHSPSLALYAQDWGREGDCGLAAMEGTGKCIGLIWARLFPESAKGYGWIRADVPEVGLAIHPEYRGQGIGSQLLRRFLQTYGEQFLGFSLSVRADNEAALHLYEQVGFKSIEGGVRTNRVGGTSLVMVWMSEKNTLVN